MDDLITEIEELRDGLITNDISPEEALGDITDFLMGI